MYESRAYDNERGNPVVVLVATGTHDVSRLVNLLSSGNCEQIDLADKVRRQVRRHNGGRAALQLLAAHGGPDFLFEPDVGITAEMVQAAVFAADDQGQLLYEYVAEGVIRAALEAAGFTVAGGDDRG